MLIRSIYIERYRSVAEAHLTLDDLTVLVGRNGAGKSTWLQAMSAFYDISATFTDEDFYNRDVDRPIVLRVTYGDLRPEELNEFKPYLENNQLTVTKRIEFVGGRSVQKYYAASKQIRKFAEIRAIGNKTQQRTSWNQLVDSGELPDLPGKATNAQQVEDYMAQYEAAHPELCETFDREEQFFGPRNVGGGKLDKFTKFVYVPAVHKASDEVGAKRGSYLYQLLDTIVYRRIASRADVIALKNEFQSKVKEVFSTGNLVEIRELGGALQTTLARFIPGAAIDLSWEEVSVPEIPNPTPIVSLGEDNFWGDVSRKGHGLQRGLIMTLLQHLATVSQEQPTSGSPGVAKNSNLALEAAFASQEAPPLTHTPDLILAIEEPELYQHPLRCRYLAQLFVELTTPVQDAVARNQIMLTTHSPWFVDLGQFKSVRIVKKNTTVSPSTTTVHQYTLDAAAKEMARISGGDPKDYTPTSFRARAIPVMTTQVSEGFFADKAIVAEGLTEVATLWAVAGRLGVDLVAKGLSVIGAGGKNNLDRPVVIFRGLGIPTFFVFDGDAGAKNKAETATRNRRYLSLAGAPIVDFPDTQVCVTWACFRDDIETYFEEVLGERYRPLREEVAAALGYDEPSKALKNYDAVLEFVDRVYSEGFTFPVLEQILTVVCELH